LQRYFSKLALWFSVGVSCVLLSGTLCAQNSDNPPPQPAPSQRTNTIRQMIQAEAARRAAQRNGQLPATPPGTTAPNQTVPPSAQPDAPLPTAAQPSQDQTAPAPVTQSSPKPPVVPPVAASPAMVKNVKVIRDKEKKDSVLEITTSRPVPPALQTLVNPARLVIDLPNANVAVKRKDIAAKGDQFLGIHVDQYQVSPPVTRVTVDLLEARQYTWDGAGNRLTIRLKPPDEPKTAAAAAPLQPTTIPTFSAPTQPAVVPVSAAPTGSAVLAGSRIGSGSTVTASAETAVLHIARGGELHVCPGSTVSVTASKSGQELMFGMSTGALETHYRLGTASDAVLTPDFRILLAGPGEFNYAISSNPRGDTCVRALLGNTASLMISELMGDRTYQVKPTEQVVFHQGRIDQVSNDVPFDCGCAAPPPPVMRASVPPSTIEIADANLPPDLHLPSSTAPTRSSASPSLDPMLPPLPNASRPAVAISHGTKATVPSNSAEAIPPTIKPADIHVQIEAPLVFRGTDKSRTVNQTASNMPPKPPATRPRSDPTAPVPPPTPPPTPKPVDKSETSKQHRGFFGRVKGLFSAMFH
jgi:AMIN domain-containing protein